MRNVDRIMRETQLFRGYKHFKRERGGGGVVWRGVKGTKKTRTETVRKDLKTLIN